MGTEVRTINEKTGGQKGTKGIKWSLLPWDMLRMVTEHYAAGAKKYAAWNWRKGYDWSLSYDSLTNHLTAFWMEHEWLDEETQTPHLAAVVFHALALMFFHEHRPELDDRPPVDLEPTSTETVEAVPVEELTLNSSAAMEIYGDSYRTSDTARFTRTGEIRPPHIGEFFLRVDELSRLYGLGHKVSYKRDNAGRFVAGEIVERVQ